MQNFLSSFRVKFTIFAFVAHLEKKTRTKKKYKYNRRTFRDYNSKWFLIQLRPLIREKYSSRYLTYRPAFNPTFNYSPASSFGPSQFIILANKHRVAEPVKNVASNLTFKSQSRHFFHHRRHTVGRIFSSFLILRQLLQGKICHLK